MNKKLYTILAAFVLGLSSVQAQNEDVVFNEKGNASNDNVEVFDTIYSNKSNKRVFSDDDLPPEGMVQDIDELLKEYNAEMYIQPDANCNSKDENPYFDEETYVKRLQRMPTIIDMPYNDVVRRYIDRYAERQRRTVSYLLAQQNFYMPFFEQALDAYNVPLELKYLPIIESALKPKAVSKVGATGLWQFMLATGKQYGLVVNSLKDERCDPEKSSWAAARFLSHLYKIFGDWHLAIAAYNCGPGNVSKAIKRAGGVKDFWKIYNYLPQETRGYVPAFIAANYIMNYYCDHNICPMTTTLPAKTDTIHVDRDVNLRQVSAVLGLDLEMLRSINPMYKRDIINGSGGDGVLRLPVQDINRFIEKQADIMGYRKDEMLKRERVDEVESGSAKRTSNDQPSAPRQRYQAPKKEKYHKTPEPKNNKRSGKNEKKAPAKNDSKKGKVEPKKGKAPEKKAPAKKAAPEKKAPAKKAPAKKGKK